VTPGADLPFTVVSAVIPEPDSITLALIAFGLVLGTRGLARSSSDVVDSRYSV
jgi:hypothetical protein